MVMALIATYNIFIQLGCLALTVIGSIAVIKNLAVWHEIFTIQKERMDNYEKGNKYID